MKRIELLIITLHYTTDTTLVTEVGIIIHLAILGYLHILVTNHMDGVITHILITGVITDGIHITIITPTTLITIITTETLLI